MTTIAFLVGALVPAILISQLLLLLTRRWRDRRWRLLACYGATLLLMVGLNGFGAGSGGLEPRMHNVGLYLSTPRVWLIFAVPVGLLLAAHYFGRRWRQSRRPTVRGSHDPLPP
jgi:hypothetical protein